MEDQVLLRYSRQILLPEFDISGQERLAAARVLIIGLGGLGSPVALYLAAAGVGRLTVNDFDTVELSNLQRQITHTTDRIGQRKVDSARLALQAINPLVAVDTLADPLSGSALRAAVTATDVVVDCSDNLSTRLALNAACVAARRPLVCGAAIRFEGQVLVVRPDQPNTPCYRCLYRDTDMAEERCSQTGVLAPLLGIIGSIQAVETFKLLLGQGELLQGRLLLLDALHMESQSVSLPKNPHCPVCAMSDATNSTEN